MHAIYMCLYIFYTTRYMYNMFYFAQFFRSKTYK